MRLGIITEHTYPDNNGGVGADISCMARCLKDAHPEVDIEIIASKHVYRGDHGRLPAYQEWDGIKIFRLNTPKSNRNGMLLRLGAGVVYTLCALAKLLSRPRYDLVLVVTNPPSSPLAANLYRRFTGTPYVYGIYDLYPDVPVTLKLMSGTHPVVRFSASVQRGWLHGAARVTVLGRCMVEHMYRHYNLPRERMDVITNGSFRDAIVPKEKHGPFREERELSGFVVLYSGNFGMLQDFDTVLDAAKLLKESSPEVTLVMIGQGPRRDHIVERVEREQISNVRVYPFVPKAQMSESLACADVSLVMLEPGAEGLGVPSKFYSILSSGRPTVAVVSEDSEVARVVEEADCGVRVEQCNPEALAEAIRRLAADPERVERMGLNARRVLEEKYTWPTIAEKFYQTFQRVLTEHKRPAASTTRNLNPNS